VGGGRFRSVAAAGAAIRATARVARGVFGLRHRARAARIVRKVDAAVAVVVERVAAGRWKAHDPGSRRSAGRDAPPDDRASVGREVGLASPEVIVRDRQIPTFEVDAVVVDEQVFE